jgi:hypothetical protein
MVLRLALDDSIARSSSEQRDRLPAAMRRHVEVETRRDETTPIASVRARSSFVDASICGRTRRCE